MRSVLDHIVGGALALVMGSMTVLVFASVVLRYILNSPVTWSEELASLLFAWLTFVGAYVGFRTHSHIRIDTMTMFLPSGVRAGVRKFVKLGVLSILGVFIWQGTILTRTTWSLEFPAMEISRGYLYLSLPVGACLMVVAILLSSRRDAAGRGKDVEREC